MQAGPSHISDTQLPPSPTHISETMDTAAPSCPSDGLRTAASGVHGAGGGSQSGGAVSSPVLSSEQVSGVSQPVAAPPCQRPGRTAEATGRLAGRARQPRSNPVPPVLLAVLQLAVAELVRQGRNVFFTGDAGTVRRQELGPHACTLRRLRERSAATQRSPIPLFTNLTIYPVQGKSFLLNHIIAELRGRYGEEDFRTSVAVTAATGIAATHIQVSVVALCLARHALTCFALKAGPRWLHACGGCAVLTHGMGVPGAVQGTTLHSALGCGAPQTTDDFGRMWKADNRKRLRALRVRRGQCDVAACSTTDTGRGLPMRTFVCAREIAGKHRVHPSCWRSPPHSPVRWKGCCVRLLCALPAALLQVLIIDEISMISAEMFEVREWARAATLECSGSAAAASNTTVTDSRAVT